MYRSQNKLQLARIFIGFVGNGKSMEYHHPYLLNSLEISNVLHNGKSTLTNPVLHTQKKRWKIMFQQGGGRLRASVLN